MNDNTTDTLTLDLADDRGMGLAMLVTFTASALIVTGTVAMLALISTWWVLGLAFGVHLLMTTAVGYVSFTALYQRMPRSCSIERMAPLAVRPFGQRA